ncbi:hypothetical protein H4R33_005961 [Dimargaris cristalligena]|uniref:Mitochondrial carrier domain-containing protein n=1 Tax=Dimargaris cristalligena TaxID=215637 RepID=A0A4P9ZMK9_9FUNG|nr:hypothetical protein H4R33_005961 [Dimargaris cristalligena]RKP34624.1 mitochondrial carrier domain-containing protein [Dimargaris cristalligena]|eukprot:RKP34624.1 mitochondrial carrier domain-containing protein [Dimargaris cristalligena]
MSSSSTAKTTVPFWFGGFSASVATVCTHPLDLVKVRLQTTQTKGRGMVRTLFHVARSEGLPALFNGLSASLLRQATYSTVRFGTYDYIKHELSKDHEGPVPLYKMLIAASSAGLVGGAFGNPADIVNVRMQNDGQLPLDKRRNYKHALDGLLRISREEGVSTLFRGLGPNTNRAILMTCSQLASYDAFKQFLLSTPYFQESTTTHFAASLLAGVFATTVCSPVDVIKTRIMNSSKGGKYKNAVDALVQTVRHEGMRALFKGWLPSFSRLGPHTIITFMVLEKISIYYRSRHPA